MFSIECLELVKALHESFRGYRSDDRNGEYDNVIGICAEIEYYSGCLYEKGNLKIPCFECQRFYSRSTPRPW